MAFLNSCFVTEMWGKGAFKYAGMFGVIGADTVAGGCQSGERDASVNARIKVRT